jgi:uncharacterized membrane protein YgdD (TMEM256/DUF423 family)
MRAPWIRTGAALGLLGVALGAFGAHALRGRLDEQALDWWRTGVLYHLLHAAPVALLGLLPPVGRSRSAAGIAFTFGVVLFSGTLYALAIGGPRWLGALTPVGGIALLLGWGLLGVAAGRPRAGA